MGEHEKRHGGSGGGAVFVLGVMLMFVLLAGWVALDGWTTDGGRRTTGQGQALPLQGVIADARATVGAAQAQMRETERAREERRARATLQAAQTQGAVRAELDLIEGRLEASRVAMEMGFQVAEATEAAGMRATQGAAAITQQAGATQAAAPTATAQAFTAKVEYERMKYQAWVDVFWLFFWPFLGVVILVGLVLGVFVQGLRFLDWVVKWLNLKHSVRVPDGRLVWDVKGELPSVVTSLRTLPFSRGPNHLTPGPFPEMEGGVRQLTPSGSVLASGMAPRRSMAGRQRRDLIMFLETAVRVAGEGSKVIPGWRSMPGFSSSAWQEQVAVLAEGGLVVPRMGVATYVGEGIEDLGDLLERVELKRPNPT